MDIIDNFDMNTLNDFEDISTNTNSDITYNTTLLLAFFMGLFGTHRFYTNKIGTGVALFLTTVLTGFIGGIIWTIVDLITILTGNFTDKDGNKIKSDRPFFKTKSNILVIGLFGLVVLLFIFIISWSYYNKDKLSIVSDGKAELKTNGDIYTFNIDPALVHDIPNELYLSLPYEYNEEIYLHTRSFNYDGIKESCNISYFKKYTVTVLSQEVTNNRCSLIYKAFDDNGERTIRYHAIEITYFEKTDMYILHSIEGRRFTDEQFINYVNQTLNTTKLK